MKIWLQYSEETEDVSPGHPAWQRPPCKALWGEQEEGEDEGSGGKSTSESGQGFPVTEGCLHLLRVLPFTEKNCILNENFACAGEWTGKQNQWNKAWEFWKWAPRFLPFCWGGPHPVARRLIANLCCVWICGTSRTLLCRRRYDRVLGISLGTTRIHRRGWRNVWRRNHVLSPCLSHTNVLVKNKSIPTKHCHIH